MEEQGELEKVSSISLRQMSESQLALRRPERQLSEAQIVQVGELMANMMAGYPHQALEMAAEVYQMAFEDLAKMYGLQELQSALRLFLTHQKFFPHPSEVREVLEDMANKAKAAAIKALPKIGCPKCHDGGWADGYILVLNGQGRQVKKCDCLIAREAAKAAQSVVPDGKTRGGVA